MERVRKHDAFDRMLHLIMINISLYVRIVANSIYLVNMVREIDIFIDVDVDL